jgi:hypothetical protein
MIFYNLITELVSTQFLTIALFEVIVVIIALFVFKRKITAKILFFTIIIAFILSLLSIIIVRGNYGGMAYHERFGWPFQFNSVSRNIEIGTNVSIPYSFHFDFLKFIANTFFWGFIPLVILLEFFNKEKNKKYKIFAMSSLVLFILLTTFFSYSNSKTEIELNIGKVKEPTTTLPISNNSGGDDILSRKETAIESEYPELKNFEGQKSFVSQSIKTVGNGNNHYFAYIVHGSGLPIVQATCFRVDRMFRVFKVGEFPDLADSYIGYGDVDTKTCTGIK